MSQRVGSEESWNSVRDRCPVAQSLIEAGKGRVNIPDRILLHPPPEFFQLRKAILDSVARDEARVDGADRRADDPVWLDSSDMQGLLAAGLVRAQGAAAL